MGVRAKVTFYVDASDLEYLGDFASHTAIEYASGDITMMRYEVDILDNQ